jgi:hypothetical protein
MNILFFGDLVGRPARKALREILPAYKKKHKPDLVIANGDNLAHGKGITRNTVEEIIETGVDVLTCGDHAWDTSQSLEMFRDRKYNLLCPANIPILNYKKGYKMVEVGAKKVLVVNLVGRVFFARNFDCPFRIADKIIKDKENSADIIIVDFHCEATSEKRALGFYLNSRVSAVLGTHTHVQTADEEILNGETAYISDVGMVGPKDSILGCKKDVVINQMLTQIPFRYKISDDSNVLINAVVLEIDSKNGKAKSIKRLNETVDNIIQK